MWVDSFLSQSVIPVSASNASAKDALTGGNYFNSPKAFACAGMTDFVK